jgi:hypothetical protein
LEDIVTTRIFLLGIKETWQFEEARAMTAFPVMMISLSVFILYNQREATYTTFFYYYQCSICFGWFFRPSSVAYKTVCEALGIVMLSCCLPLVWMCCSNPSTPAVDDRKA